MIVRFNEISPQGSTFEFNEIRELADQQDFVLDGPVTASCTLDRKGESKVVLQGRVTLKVQIACDRCLRLYSVAVDTEFQQLYALDSEEAWQVKDVESMPADLETEILDEPVIDLDDALRQQVYLALPLKKLCIKGCAGLCLQCGANLNETPCGCEKVVDSPFAVLAKLKQ
nr:DUF177 domain-containing protein [uncultured Desulfobulbus sp.]